MPRFWHKIFFCKLNKKIHMDYDNSEVVRNVDTKQFSNELSKAIKESFEAHLNQLEDINIK